MLYETILGDHFFKLHPEIQKRYQSTFEHTLLFKGIMETVHISPLLKPLAYMFRPYRFLLPINGSHIPFTIKLYTIKKSEYIYDVFWEREFFLQDQVYRFDSVMQFNLQAKTVIDSLGNPAVVKAPLLFNVTNEGELLMRGLNGQQLAVLPFKLPIPTKLGAKAFVLEGYDDKKDVHTIHLSTYSDTMGNLMRYTGYFTIEQFDKDQAI